MSQSLFSEGIQIPMRSKSQSISDIEHEQLRVSFSVLSILQSEDGASTHQKQLKSLTTRQEQQFNKEYNPYPKNSDLHKKGVSPKVKSITLQGEKINRRNDYTGEYFQNTQILTPKMNLKNHNKNFGLSNKSSKKDILGKRSKSKNTIQQRQKVVKNIQTSTKKFSSPFKFLKRNQKSPSDYDLRQITSPYGPRAEKTPSKSRFRSKSKSLKEIAIISQDKNISKPKLLHKNQNQSQSLKENIHFHNQNFLLKSSNGKSSSKSRNKKTSKAQSKNCASQKYLLPLSSDYWTGGITSKPKQKSKPKHQRLLKNSAFKRLKQNHNPY